MNNGETNTRDKGVVDAYRAASDALDEQPKAQSRAAILAAAARAVEAQPQDAATGATSKRPGVRPRERMSPIAPSRRPLALVASFLVATVALVIATQTDEQRATDVSAVPAAPVAEAPSAPAVAPAPMADAGIEAKRETRGPTTSLATQDQGASSARDKLAAAPPPAAQTSPMRRQSPAPAASPPAKLEAEGAPARSERALADSSAAPKPEPGAQGGRVASAGIPVAPPPPPAAGGLATIPPPASQEERAKENANQLARAASRADLRALAETDTAGQSRLAKARPVERTAAIAEGTVEVENDPVRWMERIVALREADRDDEADRELVRLRERYPDVKVPPNALRRTGTR